MKNRKFYKKWMKLINTEKQEKAENVFLFFSYLAKLRKFVLKKENPYFWLFYRKNHKWNVDRLLPDYKSKIASSSN